MAPRKAAKSRQPSSARRPASSAAIEPQPVGAAGIAPEDDLPGLSWDAFKKISAVFVFIKLILYVLVLLTPVVYDTSSSSYGKGMLFETDGSGTLFGKSGSFMLRRLTIWDSVFFVDAAARDASYFDGRLIKGFDEDVFLSDTEPETEPELEVVVDSKGTEDVKEEDYKDISQYSVFDSLNSLFSDLFSSSDPVPETNTENLWPVIKEIKGEKIRSISQYAYEHEWAFGYGWILLIKFVTNYLMKFVYIVNEFKLAFFDSFQQDVHNIGEKKYYFSFVAIALGNLFHYLATIALFYLTFKVYNNTSKPLVTRVYEYVSGYSATFLLEKTPEGPVTHEKIDVKSEGLSSALETSQVQKRKSEEKPEEIIEDTIDPNFEQSLRAEKMALTTSLLFVLSPAGIFLGAGYSESLFALLSFIGMILQLDRKFLAAGLFFGLSTFIRSNGMLWLIVYAYDIFSTLRCLYYTTIKPRAEVKGSAKFYTRVFGKSIINAVQGVFLTCSTFVAVQYVAYSEYCPGAEWCAIQVEKVTSAGQIVKSIHLPLIYSYIQSKYWSVGFLQYWLPHNVPNFFFAAPPLGIIAASNIYFYKKNLSNYPKNKKNIDSPGSLKHAPSAYMMSYVLVAWVMLFSATFIWNIQIITRISTCLPTFYWYVAEMLNSTKVKEVKMGKLMATYFFVWIIAQSILFGAFMPPA